MRYFCVLLLVLCFCVFGCGDEGIENTLQSLSVPSAPVATITGVPPDIQEMLWGDWDMLLDKVLESAEFEKEHDVNDPVATRVNLRKMCLLLAQRDYYTKYIDAGGIAIMGDSLVKDRFFYAAHEVILAITLERPELREALSPRTGFRMILVDSDFGAVAIPEVDNEFYNLTAGIAFCSGSVDADKYFCVTPVWLDPIKTDEIWGISILVHEFAHAMHLRAINKLDPTFQDRLETAYAVALETGGVWGQNNVKLTDVREYWAYGVQDWFFDVTQPDIPQHHANFIEKDPLLYALLDEWLPFTYLAPIKWKW